MATIPDSVKAQLDADWTGAGGAEPTYYVEEDFRTKPPLGQDAIWIMSRTLDTGARPINDTFVTEEHVLEIVVNTQTSADRLKEISDEVVRILNATAITDITYQRMKSRHRNSGELENIWVYQEVITYDLKQQMKSSAAAYGAGATGVFTTVGDLKVGGDDIQDSSGAVVISFDGAGAIDALAAPHALLTDTTLTGAQLEDLLMFGSANAVWHPCPLQMGYPAASVAVQWDYARNIGAQDIDLQYQLPLPTVKGTLKLYISSVRIYIDDADVDDFVDTLTVYGSDDAGNRTTIQQETTDRVAAGLYTTAITPHDCSGYEQVVVYVECSNTDGSALDINYVQIQGYYSA